AVEGHASLAPGRRGGDVAVTVTRLDRAGSDMELLVERAPDSDDLRIELHLREPAGGVIASTAELPGQPPLRLDLVGSGPLSDWTGHLTAAAGENAQVEADLRLGLGDTVTASLDGWAAIAGLLPPDVAPLVPARAGFAADLAFVQHGRI